MRHYFDLSLRKSRSSERPEAPLGGTRAQAIYRLQIGVAGVVLMVLLVGLASLVQDRTRKVDASSVPQAAPTTVPKPELSGTDPLVEAGVVPDLPSDPKPAPSQSPATVPERGAGNVTPAGN